VKLEEKRESQSKWRHFIVFGSAGLISNSTLNLCAIVNALGKSRACAAGGEQIVEEVDRLPSYNQLCREDNNAFRVYLCHVIDPS
jgi:hypothetical protein